MVNIHVLLGLSMIHLFIPIGILIAIGEWKRQRDAKYRLHNEDMTASILQRSAAL